MSEKLAPIREDIVIARDIGAVWRVMVEEAPVWLGCLRYRAALGAMFYMQQDQAKAAQDDISGATHCEIVAIEKPSLFKFSWFVPGFPATWVSFRLEAIDAGATRVAFEHAGWEQFAPGQIKAIHDMLSGGWKRFVLPNLKRAAEA